MEFDKERERSEIRKTMAEFLRDDPESARRTALLRLFKWTDANMLMRELLDTVEAQFGAVPLGSLSGPELTDIHRQLEAKHAS